MSRTVIWSGGCRSWPLIPSSIRAPSSTIWRCCGKRLNILLRILNIITDDFPCRFYEPVVFQPNIIPICVPESDEDFIGRTAFVTGWGRLYEDGPLPSKLQEVSVPVIENKICETMYRSAGYIEHIPNIFICAGWKKGGYDSCEGEMIGGLEVEGEFAFLPFVVFFCR